MKKTIVISAINLREGGTLSILNDCLKYLNNELSSYKIIALVHRKEVVIQYENIELIEFPNSVNSYFLRLYYEYFYFKKLSKQLKPYLWLSLHDVTPNVVADIRAVYCHNPSPFYKTNIKEAYLDPKFALFSVFYKYLYKINIKKNNFIVVQQHWIAEKFKDLYNVSNIVVSNPNIENIETEKPSIEHDNDKIIFVYPSFPRIFKNFEVICEAVKKLNKSESNTQKFEVIFTIDGTENNYSRMIYEKYSHLTNIKFIGLQSRDSVFKLYSEADYLLFPSKLETWGLPITEFKAFEKPIIVADLPYSHETVGNYNKAVFFEPNNINQLADHMNNALSNQLKLSPHSFTSERYEVSDSWGKLFKILLKQHN